MAGGEEGGEEGGEGGEGGKTLPCVDHVPLRGVVVKRKYVKILVDVF